LLADAIRHLHAYKRWVPLLRPEPNYVDVDLDPGSNGVVGQIISFGRDVDDKVVLAPSWA
jgi:cell wall assembly regulator SMI1